MWGSSPGPYAWQASSLPLSFTQSLQTLGLITWNDHKTIPQPGTVSDPTTPPTPESLKQEDHFSPVQNHPEQHCNTSAQGKETKLNVRARSRAILYNCPRLTKMFQELSIQLSDGSTMRMGGPRFSKNVPLPPTSESQARPQTLSLVLIYLLFLSNP